MATAALHAAVLGPDSALEAAVSSSAAPRRSAQTQLQTRGGNESTWDVRSFELNFEFAVSLFVVSAFIVVFLIVASVVVCRAGRRHQSRTGSEVPKQQIDAAEIDRRFPGTTVDDEPTCTICLLQVELDEVCRVIDCGHVFHADCILQWWTHKPHAVLRCPVCRQKQRRRVPSDATQLGNERRIRKQQLELRERDNEEPPMPFQPCHRRPTPPQHGLLPCSRQRMEESEEVAVPVEEDPKELVEQGGEGKNDEIRGEQKFVEKQEERRGGGVRSSRAEEEEVEEQEAFQFPEAFSVLAV